MPHGAGGGRAQAAVASFTCDKEHESVEGGKQGCVGQLRLEVPGQRRELRNSSLSTNQPLLGRCRRQLGQLNALRVRLPAAYVCRGGSVSANTVASRPLAPQ